MYFVDFFKVRGQYDPRITLNHTNEHQIRFCAKLFRPFQSSAFADYSILNRTVPSTRSAELFFIRPLIADWLQ